MGILSSETIAYKYFVWSYNSMWTSLMSGLVTLHYSLLLLQRNQSDLAQFNFSQLITLPLSIIYPESLLTVQCYGSQHLPLFVQKQIWFNVSWPPEQAQWLSRNNESLPGCRSNLDRNVGTHCACLLLLKPIILKMRINRKSYIRWRKPTENNCIMFFFFCLHSL